MKTHSPATPARSLRARMRDVAHATILDAAEEAFAEEGLGASMEKIAARAGLAVGTLYNHFENRSALLDALRSARNKELFDATSAAFAQSAGQAFRERLLSVLRALVSAMQKQLAFRRLLLQTDAPQDHDRRTVAPKDSAGVFVSLSEEGRKQGVLAADPAGLQPLFLSALLRAAFGVSLHTPERLPLEQIPEVVSRQFIEGAGAKR